MNITKNKLRLSALMLSATLLRAGPAFGDPLVSIETVTIGGAGNLGDTVQMAWDGGTSGYGAVPYQYQIGKTEVTSGQYAEFLNAVAKTSDNYGLYNDLMDRNNEKDGCGITRSGSAGNWSYTATDSLKPVNCVSEYDAMRFTNWLTNGASVGADTETGVYTLSGGSAIPANPTVGRNLTVNGTTLTGTGDLASYTGTVWALASEHEWYKAAYYNVSSSTYSLYANGSNSISASEANYDCVIQYLTDASSYAVEQNGTYDMMGNVWEWTDSLVTTWRDDDISVFNAHVMRGGASYDPGSSTLASSGRSYIDHHGECVDVGFRVVSLSSLAAVPEPSTYGIIGGMALLGMALLRCRWKG